MAKLEDVSSLINVIGKENVDEIKKSLTNCLINQIEADIIDSNCWFVDEVLIKVFIDKLTKEILKEHKDEIKGKLKEKILNLDIKLLE